MEKTILIIDLNNIMFRSLFVYYPLEDKKKLSFRDKYTGGIYGFLLQLTKYVNKYSPDEVFVCTDSPPYKRREMFEPYKQDRVTTETTLYLYIKESREYIKELLERLNIPLLSKKGLEADDLISCIAYEKRYLKDRKIIVSNDNDLFQLLIDSNTILERGKGIYSIFDFEEEYKIKVSSWVDVLALTGTHNNISGVKGIGIKTALKIVQQFTPSEIFDKYPEISLYRSLIELPIENVYIEQYIPKPIIRKDITAFLMMYGIQITQDIYNCINNLNNRPF